MRTEKQLAVSSRQLAYQTIPSIPADSMVNGESENGNEKLKLCLDLVLVGQLSLKLCTLFATNGILWT